MIGRHYENRSEREHMTRKGLPNRRSNVSFKAKILGPNGGRAVYVTVSQFEDGAVAELFITIDKTGSTSRSYIDCLARSVSLGLQHGIPLSEYVEMFVGTAGSPRGIVTGYPKIKTCQGPIDLVFRLLGHEFGEEEDGGA